MQQLQELMESKERDAQKEAAQLRKHADLLMDKLDKAERSTRDFEREAADLRKGNAAFSPAVPDWEAGCKKTTSLLYKMEMDFGDLQIIGLSRIFIQIIGLSLFSPDYRISTREYWKSVKFREKFIKIGAKNVDFEQK